MVDSEAADAGRSESRGSRVALITGASSGIGESVARRLARLGWDLAIAARRRERLEELAAALGPRVVPVRTDVAVYGDREALIATALERWSRIDLLVNNAGFGRYATVAESDIEYVKLLFETNVVGLIHLSKLAAEVMVSQGSGHIVNIASTAGHVAAPPLTVYAASKHAVVGFTRGLDRELRGAGVRASVVSPGPARTPFGTVASGRVVDPKIAPGGVSIDRVARAVMSTVQRPRRQVFVPYWYRASALLEQSVPRMIDPVAARLGAKWVDSARPEK